MRRECVLFDEGMWGNVFYVLRSQRECVLCVEGMYGMCRENVFCPSQGGAQNQRHMQRTFPIDQYIHTYPQTLNTNNTCPHIPSTNRTHSLDIPSTHRTHSLTFPQHIKHISSRSLPPSIYTHSHIHTKFQFAQYIHTYCHSQKDSESAPHTYKIPFHTVYTHLLPLSKRVSESAPHTYKIPVQSVYAHLLPLSKKVSESAPHTYKIPDRSVHKYLLLQNTATHTATRCNSLQHMALSVHTCNTLQHTATHCNTLQHAATRCNTLQYT